MPAYKAGGVKKAAPTYKVSGAKKSLRRYQDAGPVNSNSSTTSGAPAINTSANAPAVAMSIEQQKFNAEQAAAASKAASIKSYEQMLLTGNRKQRKYAENALTTSGVMTGNKKKDGSTLATVAGSLLGGFGAIAPYLFKKKDQPAEQKKGGSIIKQRGGRAADSATTNTTKGQMPPMYNKGGMYKKGGAAKPMMKRTGKKK